MEGAVSMTMDAPPAAWPAAAIMACPGSPGAPLCTVTPTTEPAPCASSATGVGDAHRLGP